MEFSENNLSFSEIPRWARCLIEFGYKWSTICQGQKRTITLISMPCDSAAAGLVALGVMRKFLEITDTNDVMQHFARLKNGTRFRSVKYKGIFESINRYEKDGFWVKKGTVSCLINFDNATGWYLENGPPIEAPYGGQLNYISFYENFIPDGADGNIQPSNLKATYSGICLAGRVMGECETRNIMADIRFRQDEKDIGLDQLLSIHEWSQNKTISRMSFFNSRTKKIDRNVIPPIITVIDGDIAFLRILDGHKFFKDSHIIAIIDRTLERDRLETISQKMTSLMPWYTTKHFHDNLSVLETGISITITERL